MKRLIHLRGCFILLVTASLVLMSIIHNKAYSKKFRGKIVLKSLEKSQQIRRMEDDEYTYGRRRNHLSEVCNSSYVYNTSQTFQYVKSKYLLYDSKHNFVFCMVQKIGCTFWRRIFHLLTSNDNTSNIYYIDPNGVHNEHIPTLGQFDVITAKRVLRSATTAVFARDPYERIFSGYVNKLHSLNTFFMKALGRPIIKMTRKKATNKSMNCGHDVTFTELLQYLVQKSRNGHLMDIEHHFSPIHTHCLPCHIKYDFVGKMESFDKDASYVIRKTNLFQNRSITMSKNASIVRDIYLTIKSGFDTQKQMRSCVTLQEMFGRVWKTLQFRGLVNPDVPMPDSHNITLNMMHREAVKASDPSRVSEYKHKEVVKMYKTVDRQLRLKFREYVLHDCRLFGYDDKPPDLFS